jgi:hypothetical protein
MLAHDMHAEEGVESRSNFQTHPLEKLQVGLHWTCTPIVPLNPAFRANCALRAGPAE